MKFLTFILTAHFVCYNIITLTGVSHATVPNCTDCDHQDDECVMIKPAAAVTVENENGEKSYKLNED